MTLCPVSIEGDIVVPLYAIGLAHCYMGYVQVQGKLWEMTSAWTEELERIHAAMRELVCRRYRFTHTIVLTVCFTTGQQLHALLSLEYKEIVSFFVLTAKPVADFHALNASCCGASNADLHSRL